ncbi:MAG: DUF1329 domain-containing protein [Desulfobacterales bacterium]|nr:DUF1329 domain-containing protein [Desulfobacterales bacterium]
MIRKIIAIITLVVGFSTYASATLTPEELSLLGGDKLTAIGAEKAGNADGTIPPYTGGLTDKMGYSIDDLRTKMLIDPFADDKILYSIDSKNMDQYSEKLCPSLKMLMTKYPEFRVDVYPTRRSVAIPDYIAEGTKKSALTATLENDDKKLTGSFCGFPFPIPKTGVEALWNHILRWCAPGEELMEYTGWVITSSGRKIMTSRAKNYCEYPYWNPSASDFKKKYHWMDHDIVFAPANRAGEGLMWFLGTDKTNGDPAWQYLPGQRRVKMAPEISYDGPNTTVAGAATYDDTFLFTGSPDRYDWKILGKKEMIVPYNSYNAAIHPTLESVDQYIGPRFVNPDCNRFEVHRVWVIEGALKPGKRHIYGRRTLYLDEDSWTALMTDEYDQRDELYRAVFSAFTFNYVTQAPYSTTFYGYDFVSGVYWWNVFLIGPNLYPLIRPDSDWNPQTLAGTGIR